LLVHGLEIRLHVRLEPLSDRRATIGKATRRKAKANAANTIEHRPEGTRHEGGTYSRASFPALFSWMPSG
jgi:hypothetical protein